MTNVKISQLPLATSPLDSTVEIPVVQGGVTKRAPVNTIGFLQSGSGAQTRTVQAKLRDTVSVLDFGAVGDGVADDTVAIQAAIDAANHVIVPAGTYIVTRVTMRNGVILKGEGRPIVKRKNSASQTSVILADAKNNFAISGLRIDGNLANNATAADNISIINGCYSFTVEGCETYNAKYDNILGRGNGIFVENNADLANGTRSRIDSNTTNDCAVGILARKVFNLSIEGNAGEGNTFGGIKLDDPTLPAPNTGTTGNIVIAGNHYTTSGVGIGAFGNFSDRTALGDILSQGNYTQTFITIDSNVTVGNQLYGLVAQGQGFAVTSNIVKGNGSDTSNGGMLFNAAYSLCDGNVVTDNYYYGIDAGLAILSTISDNIISRNGKTVNQAIGLNAGASNKLTVRGNDLASNGGNLAGSYSILASGVDGTGAATGWAPFTGFDLNISNNTFTLDDVAQVGVRVLNGFAGVSIKGNTVFNRVGGTPFEVHVPSGSTLMKDNDVLGTSGSFGVSVTSAATTVIPDYGDVIFVDGTATIDFIRSASQQFGRDKVTQVNMTNNGTGYTSAPTVSFSGGGGSGAAGTAAVAADGKVYGVYITNYGSGYTSAPTVSFTGGGGSGAAGTAFIGCDASAERIVTLRFSGAAVVKNGTGNIFMSADFTGSGIKTLTLRSAFENWYEVSRA
jgi:hypothetical protein